MLNFFRRADSRLSTANKPAFSTYLIVFLIVVCFGTAASQIPNVKNAFFPKTSDAVTQRSQTPMITGHPIIATSSINAAANISRRSVSGAQVITMNDYSILEYADDNPCYCGIQYSSLQTDAIAAVEGLSKGDCGTCLKVCGAVGCVTLLAVDQGGRGLDISTGAQYGVLGADNDIGEASWEEIDREMCQGIWNGNMYGTEEPVGKLRNWKSNYPGDIVGPAEDMVSSPSGVSSTDSAPFTATSSSAMKSVALDNNPSSATVEPTVSVVAASVVEEAAFSSSVVATVDVPSTTVPSSPVPSSSAMEGISQEVYPTSAAVQPTVATATALDREPVVASLTSSFVSNSDDEEDRDRSSTTSTEPSSTSSSNAESSPFVDLPPTRASSSSAASSAAVTPSFLSAALPIDENDSGTTVTITASTADADHRLPTETFTVTAPTSTSTSTSTSNRLIKPSHPHGAPVSGASMRLSESTMSSPLTKDKVLPTRTPSHKLITPSSGPCAVTRTDIGSWRDPVPTESAMCSFFNGGEGVSSEAGSGTQPIQGSTFAAVVFGVVVFAWYFV
ncbi:hypothetical protein MMC09_001134 [Bachmanniomyces sp. S44760]|nr:hypothetical protein [Bachmanniomyces sp. S44760]